MQPICDRELHEECGVFGVVGVPDAANLTYYGLHSLQHRGQEGCGIVSVSKEGAMRRVRGEGLVTEVFNEAKLANLAGDMAIGHVRYSTAGGGGTENIQPFLFHHNTGDFALAHNGNIVNADLLRNYLENKGSLFQSTSDSEVFAHLIKKEVRNHNRPRIYSIIEANKLAAAGKIEPAVMVTHVGGINSIIDTTLNLPKIPGGKKLTYTQFDMPLTAIDDFEKLGKTDPLFAKLDAACKENRGMWSAKAEKILFEHFGVEI